MEGKGGERKGHTGRLAICIVDTRVGREEGRGREKGEKGKNGKGMEGGKE